MVNTLRSDPQTSEEEHFKLMLVQTEMERVKYLVRSYVRTRLHKVCPLLFFATSKAGSISQLRPNYIIYYQGRNCNMLSGMSIFHFPFSIFLLIISGPPRFPSPPIKRVNRVKN
jgi:hypothetical protein